MRELIDCVGLRQEVRKESDSEAVCCDGEAQGGTGLGKLVKTGLDAASLGATGPPGRQMWDMGPEVMFQFLIRAHARAVGSIPGERCVGGS